ncbi:MAG TPA: DsbC family protein [Steroidobacteraceae bacterium]|nr:DsbC family protein [Steroidobacteraceae bacterium]
MKNSWCRLLAGVLAAVVCGSVLAAEPAGKQPDPRAAIAKKFPDVKVEDVKLSPIPGVYQVPLGADVAYVSSDGRYIIAGDLYEIDTRTNITEQGRAAARAKLLGKLDERDMIVFSPKDVKYTITVFTDVECGYCRKLHSQIDQLTKLGVRVRYAAYPRAGPNTDDWHKMEQVWCAKDRQAAITQAKLGQQVKADNCGTTPIGKQFQLGEDLGVRGTPAIFTRTGDYIGGYLPPADLVKAVEESEAKEKKGS